MNGTSGSISDGGAVWLRTEAEALTLASDPYGLAIVDLDETLYLRNSTEQFINLATPGLVAVCLLRVLDKVAPWRWTGGRVCRDNWRLLLVVCLFPWTLLRWRRFCREKAPSFINVELLEALRRRPSAFVIASNGYRPVIGPLLRSLDLREFRLVCCNILRFRHRILGKLALLQSQLSEEDIATSTVITDSLRDAPLLAACERPCLTVWKDAVYAPAFSGRYYLPGDYVSKIKRPRSGALRRLARDDLFPWVLAGLIIQPDILAVALDVAGLVCLFFSMWCYYELGYHDNDQCAIKYESDGVTTVDVQSVPASGLALRMIVMGSALGILGIALAVPPFGWLMAFGAWFGGMAALTIVYRWYNRVDKNSRVWIYLILQLFRFGSVFLVVPGSAVGMALAGSQTFTRWIDYAIYRYIRQQYGKAEWPDRPKFLARFVILLVLLIPVVKGGHWAAFFVPATIGVLFFAYEARRDVPQIVRNYRRLDRDLAENPG